MGRTHPKDEDLSGLQGAASYGKMERSAWLSTVAPDQEVGLRVVFASLALTVVVVSGVLAAGPDNTVEWGGISHIPILDRSPVCPLGGQPFALRVQAWANDLTSVRVRVEDGGTAFITADLVGSRGPYDAGPAALDLRPSSSRAGPRLRGPR